MPANSKVEDAKARFAKLSRPSEALLKVIRGVEDTPASLRTIANWIKAVSGLENFLIPFAQSQYGLGRKFNTLDQITVATGARPIQAQCTFFLLQEFVRQIDISPISSQKVWSDSLRRGALAYKIAQTAGYPDPREALIVGLIQDLGLMVTAAMWPEERHRLQASLDMPASLRLQEEHRVSGFTHAQCLRSLSKAWRLNPWFIEAIGDHHNPKPSSSDRRTFRLTQICSIADNISDIFQTNGNSEAIKFAKKSMTTLESRSPLELEAICYSAMSETVQIAEAFQIDAETSFNIDLITLATSTKSTDTSSEYQHLADQLDAVTLERNELRRLLDRAYNELKELRVSDPITEVTNRDYFLRSLDTAVQSLARQEAPFSLVLVNLDNFTLVNTSHGYEVGDEILRQYARRVATILRPSDLIGRIGNDTLAVLLREAAADGGTIAARRCLAAINGRPFYTPDQKSIKLTASFGGATAIPSQQTVTGERILAMAENALREAKQGQKQS